MNSKYPYLEKQSLRLTNSYYLNAKTSTLSFRFRPYYHQDVLENLASSDLETHTIDDQYLYILDSFFDEAELEELRSFSEKSSFSRKSYGSDESQQMGEKPALSMNGKERWDFFFQPPKAVISFYKLLETLSEKLEADIFTIPWELVSESSASPATIANFVESVTCKSMQEGKHQDYSPKNKLPFLIPLYDSNSFHPEAFINGTPERPYMLSIMIYVTAENYDEDYKMGTRFWNQEGSQFWDVPCRHGRVVIFEGDIFHSMSASAITENISTWRVSYVYKLIFNPKKPNQSLKTHLFEFLSSFIDTLKT